MGFHTIDFIFFVTRSKFFKKVEIVKSEEKEGILYVLQGFAALVQ